MNSSSETVYMMDSHDQQSSMTDHVQSADQEIVAPFSHGWIKLNTSLIPYYRKEDRILMPYAVIKNSMDVNLPDNAYSEIIDENRVQLNEMINEAYNKGPDVLTAEEIVISLEEFLEHNDVEVAFVQIDDAPEEKTPTDIFDDNLSPVNVSAELVQPKPKQMISSSQFQSKTSLVLSDEFVKPEEPQTKMLDDMISIDIMHKPQAPNTCNIDSIISANLLRGAKITMASPQASSNGTISSQDMQLVTSNFPAQSAAPSNQGSSSLSVQPCFKKCLDISKRIKRPHVEASNIISACVIGNSRFRRRVTDVFVQLNTEQIQAQLGDTSETLNAFDIAPPTKILMNIKGNSGVEKIFSRPCRKLSVLQPLYDRRLSTTVFNNMHLPEDVLEWMHSVRPLDHDKLVWVKPRNRTPAAARRKLQKVLHKENENVTAEGNWTDQQPMKEETEEVKEEQDLRECPLEEPKEEADLPQPQFMVSH